MSEFHQYRAFGLNILSALELSDLSKNYFIQEDVSIIFGNNPKDLPNPTAKGALYQATKGRFLFKMDGIASYYVEGGYQIVIDISRKAALKDVQLFLLGPVFGALIHQKGLLPLHGSTVMKANKSTIICGSSGAGKSTLAAFLFKKGYTLLADDISVINTTGKTSSVASGITNLKLWQDVAEELFHDYYNYPRVRDQLNRYKIPASLTNDELENYITNIIILEKKNTEGFELKKIYGAEKFLLLKNNTYREQYVWGLDTTLNHFQKLNKLIANVNVFTLHRPSSPLLLNELYSFIKANHII